MEEDDFISKTQRKKRMTALQDVGAELVKLSAEQLARIEMPESLRVAITEARRLTTHEAIRRQLQHIGRIMREIDAAPVQEQLSGLHAPSRQQTALFHVAEKWRIDLLAEPAAMDRFVAEFPHADGDRLRALVTATRAERESEQPPRKFRELFHVLSAIVQDQAKRQA